MPGTPQVSVRNADVRWQEAGRRAFDALDISSREGEVWSMKTLQMARVVAVLAGLGVSVGSAVPSAHAGVFNTSRFTMPGSFSIGLEPEVHLTSESGGAGVGANLRYTHGINELVNVQGVLGTGNGPKKFRVGGGLVFDFFPDVETQPGIGLATQMTYLRDGENRGRLEAAAVPYIHKTFRSGTSEVDPFLSVPLGFALVDGTNNYVPTVAVAIGSVFKGSQNVNYIVELGLAVANTSSYVSGGIVYSH